MDSIFEDDPTKKTSGTAGDSAAGQTAVPAQPTSKSIFSEEQVRHPPPTPSRSARSQLDSSIFQDAASKTKSTNSTVGQTATPSQPVGQSIFTEQQAANTGQLTQPLPQRLSPTLVAGLTLITLNFYWLYWLWTTYKRIRLINPAATKITPGKAWGFLFIPIFGAFWLIRIVFDLPRAIQHIQGNATTGMRFGRSAASAMCIVGSLWPLGLNYSSIGLPVSAGILWIAGCEALILGFLAYCQAALNRAAPTSTGGAPTKRQQPERLLLVAVGAAACCAVLAFSYSLRPTHGQLAQQAQEALGGGDFVKAASLLEKMTTPEAKLQLASLYKNGLGVDQDTEKAVSLVTDAANTGLAIAETTLGHWYANGEGVKANPTTAVAWYHKAASQGDKTAAVLLGLAYAAGDGVEQDPAEAYMWFTVAEKHGNDYATSEKAILGDLLTAAQKERAEDQARVKIAHESGGQP
jgi:hypothetical protein